MSYSDKCVVCGKPVSSIRAKYCGTKCRYANREKAVEIGQKFNRLTLIKEVDPLTVKIKSGTTQNKRRALCSCDCGNTTVVNLGQFWMGIVKSCGCIAKENLRRMAAEKKIKIPYYRNLKYVWYNMINRCTKPTASGYPIYGGAGVSVCKEWVDDFIKFYNWAVKNGWKPGMQIDKDILGAKLYGPHTCLIVTTKVNGYNRSTNKFVLYLGERISVAELADRFHKPIETIKHRIYKRGMSPEEAISIPIRKSYKRRKNRKSV